MKCPKCSNHLFRKSEKGTLLRTKGPILFDKNGICTAKCYWCSELVTIPLELRKATERFDRFVLKAPEGGPGGV